MRCSAYAIGDIDINMYIIARPWPSFDIGMMSPYPMEVVVMTQKYREFTKDIPSMKWNMIVPMVTMNAKRANAKKNFVP
jgi:hypothetical protein